MLNKDEIWIIYLHYFRIKADEQNKYKISDKLWVTLYMKQQITKIGFFTNEIIVKLTNRKVIG